MRRPFWVGMVVALVLGALVAAGIAAIVVTTGAADVAASNPPPAFVDRILAYAAVQSIRTHSRDLKSKVRDDRATLEMGLSHYREMCITCHGGPGLQPEEFAAGLHPSAPDLVSAEIQSTFTDAMLYQTISGGIGSTGMPAFASTHTPEQMWAIVSFVRHLNKLTAEEKRELAEKGEQEEGEHAAPDAGEAKAAANAPGGLTVSITGFKFNPAKLEVHEGDAVEWVNRDFVGHTATADDKTFDTGDLKGGASKRVVMSKKGTFPYTCRYHSGMKGTIVVE